MPSDVWKLYGPNSLLITFAARVGDEAFAVARAIAADIEANPPPGLREHVPGFTTMLLDFDTAKAGDLHVLGPSLAARWCGACAGCCVHG